MGREAFACIHCGQKFAWRPGADIHCGEDCRKGREQAIATAQQQLRDKGFKQVDVAPNLWEKDGVAVAVEFVIGEGIDAVIESHANALRWHREHKPLVSA